MTTRGRFLLAALSAALLWGAAPAVRAGGVSTLPPGPETPSPERKDAKALWAFRESVSLGVPEQELAELVANCRSQGFTMAEIQRILGLIARAKLAGLPHEDLLGKLREGLAKGAQPELIDAALAGKAQTLRRSKTLVDSLLMDGYVARDYNLAIKVIADALDAGLSQQQIFALVRDGRPPPAGMPDPGKVFRKSSAVE